MYNYSKVVTGTTQREPILGREREMEKNHAGGCVFTIDKWAQLRRFLILGTESGSYYCKANTMTKESAKVALECIQENGVKTVDICVEVSDRGLAPKNDPAIFIMALCASFGDKATKAHAFTNLGKVCRIGTHIMMFTEFCKDLRGWGRGMRKGIAKWYTDKELNNLIYQMIKYQSRANWSHRDLLRKSHAITTDPVRNQLYAYMVEKPEQKQVFKITYPELKVLEVIRDLPRMSADEVCSMIEQYRLPREVIPTELLNNVKIWRTMLYNGMPLDAMLRNLGKMTSIGLIAPMSDEANLVVARLLDDDYLSKSRMHPIKILTAAKVYALGHGIKGSLTWEPVTKILDALDQAFYKSFKYVEPSGKRFSISLDVSGSMWSSRASGADESPLFCAAEVAGAMALSIAKTEGNYECYGFSTKYGTLGIRPSMKLEDVSDAIRKFKYSFGRTDCALPMLYAEQNKIPFDMFVIYTDNETWFGDIHPVKALEKYREKMGINAKLIVCATSVTRFSIADPKDPRSLDIVGFDSSQPQIISEFAKL